LSPSVGLSDLWEIVSFSAVCWWHTAPYGTICNRGWTNHSFLIFIMIGQFFI
jgi:hypothetical protein